MLRVGGCLSIDVVSGCCGCCRVLVVVCLSSFKGKKGHKHNLFECLFCCALYCYCLLKSLCLSPVLFVFRVISGCCGRCCCLFVIGVATIC